MEHSPCVPSGTEPPTQLAAVRVPEIHEKSAHLNRCTKKSLLATGAGSSPCGLRSLLPGSGYTLEGRHPGRVRTHRVKPQAVFGQRCRGSNCLSTAVHGMKWVAARIVSPNVQSRSLTRVAGKTESHMNRAQAVGDVEGHKSVCELRETNARLLSPAKDMGGLSRDYGSHLWRSPQTAEEDDPSAPESRIHKAAGVRGEVRAYHSTPSTGKPSHIQGRSGEGSGRSNQQRFARYT
jgi:hypothetical protein